MRKLKFHEQKLLKKVDFINWSLDNNVHQSKILRKYCIKKREHVALYNKLAAQVGLEIFLFLAKNLRPSFCNKKK